MSLSYEGVAFRYPAGEGGVHGISLEVGAGELVAVIGPSGSGKTTLLQLAAGFIKPQAGRVRLGGEDVTSAPPRTRGVGVVFQSYALFPHMSAAENVAYPLRVRRFNRDDRERLARAALDRVGLADKADSRPGKLSGGQQQRVALARALVFEPRALLLDEPLSALDARRRIEMRDEIRRLQRAYGVATLHVTHDQEEALSMADRVAVLSGGRLLQVAPPQTLYEAPISAQVAAFVGHANLWRGVLGPEGVDTPLGRLAVAATDGVGGPAVTVLVRPERVRQGPGPLNTLSGVVLRDRYLGSLRRYDLDVGGCVLAVETTADPASVVHVPPEAVQLLPAECP